MKNIFEYGLPSIIGGGFLIVIDFLFGGGELVYGVLILLIIATLLDWNSGRRAAKRDGINASEYGIDGLWRTGQIYLLLMFGHFLDVVFKLEAVEVLGYQTNGVFFYIFAIGVLLDTVKSVTANHSRLGWNKWIPDWALEWVANEIENKMARAIERREKIVKHQPGE